MCANRDYIQTLRFKRVKCIGSNENRILLKFTHSIHVAASNSHPLIKTMTSFLNFIYSTTYAKQNEQEVDKFLGKNEEHGGLTLDERMMRSGPEFICSVMFNHVHFQASVLRQISFQF